MFSCLVWHCVYFYMRINFQIEMDLEDILSNYTDLSLEKNNFFIDMVV